MGSERKIEALREATDRKRQSALDKTNAAIAKLLKEGKRINFPTVAKEAGVSVTYLYKYDEIKDRINHLRKQQEQTSEKPIVPQLASDKSKQVIFNQLRERVKQLKADNRELRTKNEVVYGQLYKLQSAQQEIEVTRTENVSLRAENAWLKQQLDECRHSFVQPQADSISSAALPDSKVTSLEQKRTQRSGIGDKIKLELAAVGIKLNSTLTKTIKSTSEAIVESAIEALKEAMKSGSIERPGGWLNKAIQDGWMPNEKHLPHNQVERDLFQKWFNLAYKQRLVLASTKGEDGQMYVYNIDGVRLPFEQVLAEYPLEKLQASL